MTTFRQQLESAQGRSRSTLCIGLAPTLTGLPGEIARYDDPFLPYGKAVIDATYDLACGYVFHLGAYLALGAAGAVALERTIAYVPEHAVRILHAPFANADYVRAVYEDGFGANGVTLTYTADRDRIAPYLTDKLHGVLIEAPKGADLEAVKPIAIEFPDQIGFVRPLGEAHTYLSIGFMHWYWGDHLFTARGDDWKDHLHAQAEILRSKHYA